MITSFLFAASFLAPALGSATAAPQATEPETYLIEQRPGDGQSLVTELRTTHEFLLADMSRKMDNREPMPYNAAGTVSTEFYTRWRDDYLGLEGQVKPTVKRLYQQIELTGRATLTLPGRPTRPEGASFGSDFRGRTLAFVWGPDENKFGHCYDYYDGPEEPLALIREEGDCRSALPKLPVAIGDRWVLDAEQTLHLLTPGGNLSMVPERNTLLSRSIKLGLGSNLADVLHGQPFGQAEVVLRAVELSENGDQIAVMGIERLTVQALSERRDLYEQLMPDEEKREPAAIDSVTIDTRLEGGGELRWNLTAGHVASASIQGEEISNLRIAKIFGEEPRTMTIAESAEYKGIWKFSLKTSQPDAK